MKALNSLVIAVAATLAAPAMAQSFIVAVPSNVSAPASTTTRAEVLADLHMWRLAGLQELSQSEVRFQQSERYEEALARYHALLDSPQYIALVRQLQDKPFSFVVAR